MSEDMKYVDTLAQANLDAGNIMKDAADKALAGWTKQWEINNQDLAPWKTAGHQSINYLKEGLRSGKFDVDRMFDQEAYGMKGFDPGERYDKWKGFTADDMVQDPGYRYRIQQAEEAMRRRANAGSGANSGATLMALSRFNQQEASDEFQRARQRSVDDYMMDRQRSLDIYGQRAAEYDRAYGQYQDKYDRDYAHQMKAWEADQLRKRNRFEDNYRVADLAGQKHMDGLNLNTIYFDSLNKARTAGADALARSKIGAANVYYTADDRAKERTNRLNAAKLGAQVVGGGGGSSSTNKIISGINIIKDIWDIFS